MAGRPFEKGRSGNPGGRPRVSAELRDLARRQAPDAIKELGRLALKARNETAAHRSYSRVAGSRLRQAYSNSCG